MDMSNVRSVYKWTSAFDVKDMRINSIDSNDNVVILGDKKGYVIAYEEQMGERVDGQVGSVSEFSQLSSGKRGNAEIQQVTFLKRTMMIALLSNFAINIVQFPDLSSVQELKTKKVHMFCVNNAVYQMDQSQGGKRQVSLMDQICVVTTDKTLMFFEFANPTTGFKTIDENGLQIGGTLPDQIAWEGDTVYLATKKAYIIMSKSSGKLTQNVMLNKQMYPLFCLHKGRCLILNNGNQGFFMDVAKGQKSHITFQFEKFQSSVVERGQIIQMIMHEIYVIVIFETTIAIFNSQTGGFLEEQGVLDKFKYKGASLNSDAGDIVLITHNNSTAKNQINTKMYQLKEIPAQDQIDHLLYSCRIQEAKEVFVLKVNKTDVDFTRKKNQFFLDCGWIRFIRMLDFKESLNDFKNTKLDPRELILLYRTILGSNENLEKHFSKTDTRFDLSKVIENFKFDNNRQDINTISMVEQSKIIVCQILEHKNKLFIPDLKKDKNKMTSFQYSKFSPFEGNIKYDKQGNVILRDVVSLIQTALIKLYVEQGNQKAIFDFFDQPLNKKQIYIDATEIESFLKLVYDKSISTITMALIFEHTNEKFIEALEKWRQLNSEQACNKTVGILRKPQITKKETVFEYIKWVLEKKPDIGLKLFTERQASSFNPQMECNMSQRNNQQQFDNSGMGGAVDDMSHEEIIEFLHQIEKLQEPKNKELMSERKNLVDKVYPFREKYLEHVLSRGESIEKFETMLAELYVEKLFEIQEKDITDEIYAPELVAPKRRKLQEFLEAKNSYNASILLEKVKNSWMMEEEIILLVKEKQYEPAIEIFVKSENFKEAEQFCNARPQLGLMNTLLKIYIDKYKLNMMKKSQYLHNHEQERSKECQQLAIQFKHQGLELLKKYSQTSMLDPHKILELIPDDWEIISDKYNLLQYLKNMFDHLLTVEENQRISAHMSNIEMLNKEKDVNELKQAYLVIDDQRLCKVCNRVLKSQQYLKVYPNGGVYHTHCARDKNECPITRQRFDLENQLNLQRDEVIKFD